MINLNLSLEMPPPWKSQKFALNQVGPINFLVGPNGSGKTRFAGALLEALRKSKGQSRLLGTDRLGSMAQPGALSKFSSDPFSRGYAKNRFNYLRSAGEEGSGIDTIVHLEERADLRIQIEATLGHLFDREIILEWDSGNLIPRVRRQSDALSYRLDREECHGIKELLVLLTHLYDDKNQHLIIDEPELNLHPQYQAFFMQEVRKIAGDPTTDRTKKIVFLITHSPFILDFRSEDDLRAVISFDLEYSAPKQVHDLSSGNFQLSSFLGRLNLHHKQFFFSDNPIFVEGIHDAQLVEALMEARGVSVASAGSCIIDAGGVEEVNFFLKLCQGLGKSAYFLYDLDSLFRGNLRACLRDDDSIQGFLTPAGLGNDFGKYCGGLDRKLTCLIDLLLNSSLTDRLLRLQDYLRDLGHRNEWGKDEWSKARTAVLTAISRYKEQMSLVAGQGVADIEGRLDQIVAALRKRNIHLLPGGTIERYLPAYTSDDYELTEDAKRRAVRDEIEELSNAWTELELSTRYGKLYDAVCNLPSKADVDVEEVLRIHLSDYIHELQKTVKSNPMWESDQIRERMDAIQPAVANVFCIVRFDRNGNDKFSAIIEVKEMLGKPKRVVHVSDQTNAGMREFEIAFAEATHWGTT